MKKIMSCHRVYILGFIFFVLGSPVFAQDKELKEDLQVTLTKVAREIMTSAKTCNLITMDQEGSPRARIMDPIAPESDFTVWMGTNPKSRKVAQIKMNPSVTLYYLDHDSSGYVLIRGKAEIIDDPIEKQNHWKEAWEPFYKDRDKDFVLIKVSPEWMEVISNTRGIIGDPTTWEAPKVLFDSEH